MRAGGRIGDALLPGYDAVWTLGLTTASALAVASMDATDAPSIHATARDSAPRSTVR